MKFDKTLLASLRVLSLTFCIQERSLLLCCPNGKIIVSLVNKGKNYFRITFYCFTQCLTFNFLNQLSSKEEPLGEDVEG